MNAGLRMYSERAARIASILGRVIDLTKYADITSDSNPIPVANGLSCSWGDPETGMPQLSVQIRAIDDMHSEIRSFRDDIARHSLNRDGLYDATLASEVPTGRPDEHVFLFESLRDLRVIVGTCDVGILVYAEEVSLRDLVDAALEIGRTVGCSAYEDDFVRPEFPEKWTRTSWTAFPPGDEANEH
jgi:hypothetical protein